MTTETMNFTTGPRQLAGKYLFFKLHHESYGIEVIKVREIIRLTTITAVPQVPDYIKGVINLRGKIIPVLDLRLRFGFGNAKDTEQTCIIVAQVKLADGKHTQMGLVVDGVEEVATITADNIEETPNFGAAVHTDYILGMAKVNKLVKTLLNIDRVLGENEIKQLQSAQLQPADTR